MSLEAAKKSSDIPPALRDARSIVVEVIAFAIVAAVAIELVHLLLSFQFPALFSQIGLPFAVNGWSDGPLLVQIDRIFRGIAPYAPVYNADSFTYGPLYLYALAVIDRPFESIPAIQHLREISVSIATLSAVPM